MESDLVGAAIVQTWTPCDFRYNRRMTPEELFAKHYGQLHNPLTPKVIEYGWLLPEVLAYELSTNEAGTLYGITVVRVAEGDTEEVRQLRQVEHTEAEIRERLAELLRGRSSAAH